MRDAQRDLERDIFFISSVTPSVTSSVTSSVIWSVTVGVTVSQKQKRTCRCLPHPGIELVLNPCWLTAILAIVLVLWL
jgi:hypothetical protein